MSDYESAVDESASNIVLDTEQLIYELEKRPALYDKKLKEYSDRNFKEQLWCEVCRNVLPHWDGLSSAERLIKGKEVQKKWKNLKDCFARELAKQREYIPGQSGKKRRKYLYFDSLLFLIPSIEHRLSAGNMIPPLEIKTEIDEIKPNVPQQRPHKKPVPKSKLFEKTPVVTPKERDDIDEEKSFALMLVPMLKKLDEDQKHFAKIEILNVMKRARQPMQYMSSPNH